ncbi:alpha/beta fold hydrolase [Rhodococcus sp. IEGM 1379]|uniref:esterase/lipase family protein n=1 Tax=Rhodococcus sp. IEGM 1379 TaxID=3047086 RepID=UPI0024B7AFAE|nr:alpha/beta fold hydrolase [Rhodococcus sp. IEGM 1379]MDI9919172.1 alpha/beta fold hydrolase [Rhodococcus sp. IEGM 1379]
MEFAVGIRSVVCVTLGTVVAGVIAAPVAAASEPLPVPFGFASGIVLEALDPGGSAPGTNDFSCTPSSAHPDPVVLVHGTAANRQTNWAVLAPILANEGYCVFALTFGNNPDLPWPLSAAGGLAPLPDSAKQLSAFVDDVLESTGASRVDLIGHSQGTTLSGYYAKFLGGDAKVSKIVSIAPLWNGSEAGPPKGIGGQDFGNAIPIAALYDAGVYAEEVEYTNIVTRYDQAVVPYSSGILEASNASNIVVQDGCEQDLSDHIALVASQRTAAFTLAALDPSTPRQIPCDRVLPITG